MDKTIPTYRNTADRVRSLTTAFKYARTRAVVKRMVRTQGLVPTVRALWSDPYALGG